MKTNEDRLVELSVIGEVSSPQSSASPYRVSPEGDARVLPGTGGITYNVKVGDCATRWQADHVEPCVSVKNKDDKPNGGLNLLSCVGNEATVISGDAKGAKGCVTGKHGGIEHVLVDFPDAALKKMAIGDKVQVRSVGLGLELADFPEVKVVNTSPKLLEALPLKSGKKGFLSVPVTHIVPARIMGSGLGSSHTYRGDYDIQLFDDDTVTEYGLDSLRFGDLVAIQDADHSYGRIYKSGAVSVGVVVHSGCTTAGHGPGVTTLFTSTKGYIETRIARDANVGRYLHIGRSRRTARRRK